MKAKQCSTGVLIPEVSAQILESFVQEIDGAKYVSLADAECAITAALEEVRRSLMLEETK
ncbi:hypothetical protein [Bacteroides ihuae]|uniref:hypothetical protein n=1 Tax=Bacteroides ihuae TaxID=1852362 RepID=UPI0008D8FCE4|nr:hypothetical protein [Bacteroides ihuae]